MRVSRIHIITVVLMMLLVAAIVGQDQIIVTEAVDRQTVYIGDVITYMVTIERDSSLDVTPPLVGANLGYFDVKDYHVGEEKKISGGRMRQTLEFKIRTFTTGEYKIPPLPIEYVGADSVAKVINASPITITVKSMLGPDADSLNVNLRPERPPVSLGGESRRNAIIIGALLAILIAAAIIGWLRHRHKKEAEEKDTRPPWEIAYSDLAMLKQKNLPEKGETKLFYFELTEIFRKYLGRKFGFNAIDLTTEEIDEYFNDVDFDKGHRDAIISFLSGADLIKFAKQKPEPNQPEADWTQAYELVDTTREYTLMPLREEITQQLAMSSSTSTNSSGRTDDLRFAPPELQEYFDTRKEDDRS